LRLLGASLHILAESTHSNPYQSGFLTPHTPDHIKGILVVFYRKLKVPGGPTQRLMGRRRGVSGRHVGGGQKMEVVPQPSTDGCHSSVTRDSISLAR
jgi:hypothetical protein